MGKSKDGDMKAYSSTIKTIRVTGPAGQIQFAGGHFQTEDADIQAMIEATPSYGDIITDGDVRTENDVDVLDAKKAAPAAPADGKKPEAAPKPAKPE